LYQLKVRAVAIKFELRSTIFPFSSCRLIQPTPRRLPWVELKSQSFALFSKF
jgi:hypothetical protein